MSFGLRLLSGSCKGVMDKFILELYTPSNRSVRSNRHTLEGIQIKPVTDSNSLNVYKFEFQGALPRIWAKLPQECISRGVQKDWLKIKKNCPKYLIGKVNYSIKL